MGERSVEQAARNQVLFREANEKIDATRRELAVENDRIPLLCECEREDCTEVILVPLVEYENARRHPRRFLVREEHEDDARVVSWNDGFVVIEKDGREGELVERLSD